LFFCDDIWTSGQQPVPCAARRCALCVVVLEDKFDGQPAIALKER